MLADLMGRGESSYLYEHLVQNERIFDSLNAYQMGSIDPGILVIQGQVTEGVDIEAADQALEKVIQEFVQSGIVEGALQKVKNQAEASLVFMEVEVLNRAMNLAMAANAGDANWVNTEAEKIQAVSLSEVQSWAKSLFIDGKSNTLWYKKEMN